MSGPPPAAACSAWTDIAARACRSRSRSRSRSTLKVQYFLRLSYYKRLYSATISKYKSMTELRFPLFARFFLSGEKMKRAGGEREKSKQISTDSFAIDNHLTLNRSFPRKNSLPRLAIDHEFVALDRAGKNPRLSPSGNRHVTHPLGITLPRFKEYIVNRKRN